MSVAIYTEVALLVVAVALLMIFYPVDRSDRAAAQSMTGPWAVTSDVEVQVDYVGGRDGGYSEVDAVSVRLPGSQTWVELINVNSTGHQIDDEIETGWQTATSATGYDPR